MALKPTGAALEQKERFRMGDAGKPTESDRHFPAKPEPVESSHNLLSLMKSVEQNAVAPVVNTLFVEPANIGITLANGTSDFATWATNKVAHTNFKAPEFAKVQGMKEGENAEGTPGYYSQKVLRTASSFLAYAVAGKVAGKGLKSVSELAPPEAEIGRLKIGSTVRELGADERVAQVTGATAYAGLKDPGQGEGRFSNAMSTFLGFTAFEVGNAHLVNPRGSFAEKFGQRYMVGAYGGALQTEAESVFARHQFASSDAMTAGTVGGGFLNAMIPGGRKLADGVGDRFAGANKSEKIIEPEANSTGPVKTYVNPETGLSVRFDKAAQTILVKPADGDLVTLDVSKAAMTPVKGSSKGNIMQSPDGKTMWYKMPDGSVLRGDARDYGFRYGPQGVDLFSREVWTHIDPNGHHSVTLDGLKWNGTEDPGVFNRPDGSTYTLRRLEGDKSTQHWKMADGSERLIDAHEAQWFRGKDEPWREVATWDSHTVYTHTTDGDHWRDGKNDLFRDNQGNYWHSEKPGVYISDDGGTRLLPDGRTENITLKANSDVVSPQVERQLTNLRATQKILSDAPVEAGSVKPLTGGGMGHEAYSLNLLGPDGSRRAIFRATDAEQLPGLAETRMRKDMAGQDLSARLFEGFPAGVERDIEINGVVRKGWVQDASIFSQHKGILDMQSELHDLAAKAFPDRPADADNLKDFLNGKSKDAAMSTKGLQIRDALEKVFVERMIFGDLDNHAMNYVADFKADPPVVRHIDMDKSLRVHSNEPSLDLNNLNESGLGDISAVFSNTKLSPEVKQRLTEFLNYYDSPAGLQRLSESGVLTTPPEAASLLARARWLRDHGTFPTVRNMYGQN